MKSSLTVRGPRRWGFRGGSGSWFLLTLEGLVNQLHPVGDEVHGGGGFVVDLLAVGDEVHGGEGLVVDLHAVGDEVHGGGGLVVDLHAVG